MLTSYLQIDLPRGLFLVNSTALLPPLILDTRSNYLYFDDLITLTILDKRKIYEVPYWESLTTTLLGPKYSPQYLARK